MNFDLSSEEIRQVEVIPKLANRGLIYGLFRFVAGMLVSILTFRFNLFFLAKNKVNYLVTSSNQLKALTPIHKELGGKITSLTVGYRTKNVSSRYPDALAYLLSILFIPFYIIEYRKCKSEYQRRAMKVCFDRYILAYGLYFISSLCLWLCRPSLIFLSNDHCVWHRVFIKICKKRGIKTAYVQHAMVSKSFPVLNFTYAFLDGYESFKLYQSNKDCACYLAGAIRYRHCLEKSKLIIKKCDKPTLGLCFNTIDADSFITDMINQTEEKLSHDFNIIIRLHPRDKRINIIQNTLKKSKSKVIFNDSTSVDSMSFLKTIDVLLAGSSGIHLDAALSGVVPYTLKSWGRDYYGFIESGLTLSIDSVIQIKDYDKKTYINRNRKLLGKYDAFYHSNNKMTLASIIISIVSSQESVAYTDASFRFDKLLNAYVYK